MRRRAFGLGHAAHLQAVLDVLRDGHVREQRVLLEHGVDVAAPRGQRRDVDAAEPDRPGGGLLEARDHAQHRGLAGSRGAQDREQFAVADGEVGALDGHDCSDCAELLADTDQLYLRIINGSREFTADSAPTVSEGMANRMNSNRWATGIADFVAQAPRSASRSSSS